MTTALRALSLQIRAFRIFTIALVVAIAISTVHGWVNLGDSVDQLSRLFNPPTHGGETSSEAWGRIPGGADVVLVSVAMLAACLLAFMLAWKAWDRRDARSLALFLVLLILPANLIRSALNAFGWQLEDHQFLALAWVPQWFALAAFLRFSVLFPSPLRQSDIANNRGSLRARRRRIARDVGLNREDAPALDGLPRDANIRRAANEPVAGATPWIVWIQCAVLRPSFVWGSAALLAALTIMLALGGQGGITFGWLLAFSLIVLAAIVRGTQHLRLSYRSRDGDERRQILWIVHGFYVSMWTALLTYVVLPLYERFAPPAMTGDVSWLAVGQLLLPLILTMIVVSLYVGVFYSGALDPHRAIRTTTVYGIVLLIEILIFGAVEGLAAKLLITRVFGAGASNVGTYVAAGFVALAFRPLKRGADRYAAKRIPGLSHA